MTEKDKNELIFKILTLNFTLASNFSHTKVYIKAVFIGYWGQLG